jgi:hypothetical protein
MSFALPARMASQCVCKRWKGLPASYPSLLSDPCFTIVRPDSIVDQVRRQQYRRRDV